MIVDKIKKELKKYGSPSKAKKAMRFFKVGKGEYGEGDIFRGGTTPEINSVVKEYFEVISLKETEILLRSLIHEERQCALKIVVMKYARADTNTEREKIYTLYLRNIKYINNWDLVDGSAEYIVGDFLENKNKDVLTTLAQSKYLWERRIAIVATHHFIKNDKFTETLRIARILLNDEEDLIHKAVGWMLREVGKKGLKREEDFLKKHYTKMPRTMLRYAIERFEDEKRKAYLTSMV